jgi:hypothetical protein
MTLLDETLRKLIVMRTCPPRSVGLHYFSRIPAPRFIMNSHLLTGFTALGCILLASCHPYNENQDKKPVKQPEPKTLTAAEQKKAKEERDSMKQKEAAKKTEGQDLAGGMPPETTPSTSTTTDLPKPTTPEKKPEYKFASKVPGKEGFVFIPYNNKVVDVRDIPSGTLVQDPTYNGEGKGYFRVP